MGDSNNLNYNLDFDQMSVDQVIISLKIISLLRKNDKLCINNESLEIDQSYFFQALRRWYNDNNRSKTVFYIQRIIERTFDIIDNIYDNEALKLKGKLNDIDVNMDDLTHKMDNLSLYNNNQKYKNNPKNQKKNPFKEENSRLLQRLSTEMINASVGLDNLKITYGDDSFIKTKLDIITHKINIRNEKISKLLKINL